jgi:hypothetical protein
MTEKPEDSSALQPAEKGTAGLVRVMDRRVSIASRVLSEIAVKKAAETGISKTSLRITLEVAMRFLDDEDSVNLGEYTAIDVDAAELLAQHPSDLILDGLTALDLEAAEALANHDGWLSLNGLTALDVEVAEALAIHEGALELNGLTELDVKVIEVLVKREDWLRFTGE